MTNKATFHVALALLVASAGTNAFTAPPSRVNLPAVLTTQSVRSNDPLYVSKPTQQESTQLDIMQQAEPLSEPGFLSRSTIFAIGFAALGMFGWATYSLQGTLNLEVMDATQKFCQDIDPLTVESVPAACYQYFEANFFQGEGLWARILMWTHVFPFLLIPTTMRLVSNKSAAIQKNNPIFNPFAMNLGLATVCFGLAQEFGWHVTSQWYYVNNFHILNFGFYFFLISGFALWADGFGTVPDKKLWESWFSEQWDYVFAAILLAATILYPIGAASTVPAEASSALQGVDPNLAKIPLYIGLTVTFLIITMRGRLVFDNKMFWVPFFSVGVNLFFIFLLEGLPVPTAVGGELPGVDFTVKNYLFHIGHDLLGTEMGVLLFAVFVANYAQSSQEEKQLTGK